MDEMDRRCTLSIYARRAVPAIAAGQSGRGSGHAGRAGFNMIVEGKDGATAYMANKQAVKMTKGYGKLLIQRRP